MINRQQSELRAPTCMLGGGVRQVESTSGAVCPAHELDSDLVGRGLNQLVNLQAQTAVLHCSTAAEGKRQENKRVS